MANASINLAVELLVYIGVPVGSCVWPSLMRVRRMGNARWMAMNISPVLASADEDMTFLIVLHIDK